MISMAVKVTPTFVLYRGGERVHSHGGVNEGNLHKAIQVRGAARRGTACRAAATSRAAVPLLAALLCLRPASVRNQHNRHRRTGNRCDPALLSGLLPACRAS